MKVADSIIEAITPQPWEYFVRQHVMIFHNSTNPTEKRRKPLPMKVFGNLSNPKKMFETPTQLSDELKKNLRMIKVNEH